MKKLKRKVVRILRKSRCAVSVLDRARKGLEYVKEGMRLAISF